MPRCVRLVTLTTGSPSQGALAGTGLRTGVRKLQWCRVKRQSGGGIPVAARSLQELDEHYALLPGAVLLPE